MRCSSAQGGRRTISKFTPTFSLNSIDNPISPVTGRRYTASLGLAGLGGNTRYINPTLEGRLVPAAHHAARRSGLRAQAEYIRSLDSSSPLPIFERLVLGGGYSVRGYDLRSIGPQDPIQSDRHRRQQEPAVQRGIPDFGGRARAADFVL